MKHFIAFYSLQLTAGRRGIVLLLTFIIMITLITITTAFLYMTSTQLRSSAYDARSHQALWLAEAGLERYMYLISDGTYDPDNHPTLNGSLSVGGSEIGTYSVSSSVIEGDISDTYTLTSTGTVDVVNRQIVKTAVVTPQALARGIHADGAHVKFDNSTGTINGNVSCFTSVMNEEGMTITGTITEGDDQDKLNPALDISSYAARAALLGQTAADKTFESGNTYTDVWYITNQAAIQSNVRIEGCIISEKTIDFAGKADDILIDPNLDADLNGLNYPALYAGTNITSTDIGAPAQRIGLQNSSINGLVMAGNNITFDYLKDMDGAGLPGSNTEGYTRGFNGTIMAVNNVEMKDSKNDFQLTYDAGIFSPLPPGFTFSPDVVVEPQDDWSENVPVS